MVKVLVTIEESELDEIRKLTRVDSNATAILAAARLGANVERNNEAFRNHIIQEAGK